MTNAHITVLGARGSIPVSGSRFSRYGGNTTCFAIAVDGVAVAFIDAGTGLLEHSTYGIELGPSIDIFLTHYHWDHTQGISMMSAMWSGACDIRVWGHGDPAGTLERAISPPLFPVSISDVPTITFATARRTTEIGGITITPFPIHHPQGANGYRIDGPNRSIGIVTDHEAGTDMDSTVIEAISGVDVLIHDAQYLADELPEYAGWGHSSFEQAVEAAEKSGVSKLILTSHDPRRTDDDIDDMISGARLLFGDTEPALPGLEVPL